MSRDAIDSSQTLIIQLYRLAFYIRDAERGHRTFLLSRDSVFLDQYTSSLKQVRISRDSINELITTHHQLRPKFNELKLELMGRMQLLQQILTESSSDSFDAVRAMIQNHPVQTKLISFLQLMEQDATRLLQENLEKKRSYEVVNHIEFRIMFFFALLIFIISFIVLLREIRLRALYHQRMEDEILRTNQANKELERITFIASHDLQEPLRKIRTFSNLLVSKHGEQLNTESKTVIQRIEHSADVMQELIRDLANYANLVSHEHQPVKVDLSDVLAHVRGKFSARLKESNAAVTVDWLPIINGYPEQLFMMFTALMDNSLKFSRSGVQPQITVMHENVKGDAVPDIEESRLNHSFHKITFSDNGLGFDGEFAEKIFGMFQRLHTEDAMFSGRGMGLAIAKRVMVNHNGYITASGSAGEGADFSLYFPA